MTAILVAGISYRSAPVAVRERLAFAPGEIPAVLSDCRAHGLVDEAILLSTCNRVELYAVGERSGLVDAFNRLGQQRGVAPASLRGLVEIRCGGDAILHCFLVAASLGSMIVGDRDNDGIDDGGLSFLVEARVEIPLLLFTGLILLPSSRTRGSLHYRFGCAPRSPPESC